jgi:hypothetical protein
VGLAAPHPAAHKCAIVPFASIKYFFKDVFAESQRKFAEQGASAQKQEQQLNFSVFCSGDVSHKGANETLYLVVGTTTLSAKNP